MHTERSCTLNGAHWRICTQNGAHWTELRTERSCTLNGAHRAKLHTERCTHNGAHWAESKCALKTFSLQCNKLSQVRGMLPKEFNRLPRVRGMLSKEFNRLPRVWGTPPQERNKLPRVKEIFSFVCNKLSGSIERLKKLFLTKNNPQQQSNKPKTTNNPLRNRYSFILHNIIDKLI